MFFLQVGRGQQAEQPDTAGRVELSLALPSLFLQAIRESMEIAAHGAVVKAIKVAG